MPSDAHPDASHVVAPTQWAPAPIWMSFSTLLEIEACPRRWALRTAQYPSVWDRPGYPPLPQIAAIEGLLVHGAIDRITNALADAGCPAIRDPRSIEVLRQLGGYTSIIAALLDKALTDFEGNPRAASALDSIRLKLTSRIPELRSRVQRQVSRIDPTVLRTSITSPPSNRAAESRLPLSHGAYPEIHVRVPQLQWHGVIDLLTIADASCEIRDFKTGAIKEQDQLQIRIYALLWARDKELNPSARLVDMLVVSYDTREVRAPGPDQAALLHLEADVQRRTRTALAAIAEHPSVSNPSIENCAHCYVRHLCNDYWEWLPRRGPVPTSPRFDDFEVRITGRHGPSSWDGRTVSDEPILLRTANPNLDLGPGQSVRILNAHRSGPQKEDETPLVITLGTSSEVFFLAE